MMGHCLQILQHHRPETQQRNRAILYHQDVAIEQTHELFERLIRGPPAPKQRNSEPVDLQTLAFETFKKYVSQFSLCLMQSIGRNSNKLSNVVQDCLYLQNMLHSRVPVSFANEVTEKLLISIDGVYNDIRAWIKEPWCNRILQELVSAVIHPSITKLDLHCALRLIPSILFTRLHTMRNLKVLKLWQLMDRTCEVFIIEGLCAMVDLEIFTLHHHCSDNIIAAVGSSCKRLTILDIASSTYVTDVSIGAILKLGCLEELNLTDTSISGEGYMKLLNGLNRSDKQFIVKESLHKLGCTQIDTSHFNLIIASFPNLVEVSIRKFRNVGSTKAGITNLQIIRLTDCKFSDIQGPLNTIGNELLELELNKISDLNIKAVGENCPSLKRLTVSGYVRCIPQYEDTNTYLPGFQSLEHLSLRLYRDYSFISYMLCKCINLKTINLFITDGSEQESDILMDFVLSRNPLKKLVEFSIKTHMAGLLTLHIAKLLIERCPDITALKGINTWSSIGILEDFVEEVTEKYPHIQLSE